MTPDGGPLPIPYTADEICKTFAGLLATFDFAIELQEVGIGPLNVIKRRRAKRNFTALCIALWHVALEKSFPQDAAAFFTHFMDTHPLFAGEGRSARKLRDLVFRYDLLVSEKKDADFTKVADCLAEAFKIAAADRPRRQLKLSLRIRALYELIFDRLI
jgi:hypothetical protein